MSARVSGRRHQLNHLSNSYGQLEPRRLLVGDAIGESGNLEAVGTHWQTVSLSQSYDNPIVVTGPISLNGGAPVTTRIRNVQSDSFEIRLRQ